MVSCKDWMLEEMLSEDVFTKSERLGLSDEHNRSARSSGMVSS